MSLGNVTTTDVTILVDHSIILIYVYTVLYAFIQTSDEFSNEKPNH